MKNKKNDLLGEVIYVLKMKKNYLIFGALAGAEAETC